MKRRIFLKSSSLLLSGSLLNCNSKKSKATQKKLGVALVGLGYYSTDLLAPALQLTQHCRLAGIVTGSPEKIPVWQEKYDIPDDNVYNYDNMNQIADNDDIDVIYIVLPTGLHAEYAIKAAETGKHVWCEKPMARTEAECQSIIDACNKNNVTLSIGYRMQHEKNTQQIIQWADELPYGKINEVNAEAGYYDSRTDHWKLKKNMGGGAMYDMGVYVLNGARYAKGAEPISVMAWHENSRPEIFTEVDETTYCELNFKDGSIATCRTSFGNNWNRLEVEAENGSYHLDPFQSYGGVAGAASDGIVLSVDPQNQQARQMDDDSLAIVNNTPVMVPGEEGMRDIRIVEAIYKSASSGELVLL